MWGSSRPQPEVVFSWRQPQGSHGDLLQRRQSSWRTQLTLFISRSTSALSAEVSAAEAWLTTRSQLSQRMCLGYPRPCQLPDLVIRGERTGCAQLSQHRGHAAIGHFPCMSRQWDAMPSHCPKLFPPACNVALQGERLHKLQRVQASGDAL